MPGRGEKDQIPEFLYDQFPSEITSQSLSSMGDSPYTSLTKDPNTSKASASSHKTPSKQRHHTKKKKHRQALTLDTSVNSEPVPIQVLKTPKKKQKQSTGVSPLYDAVNHKLNSIMNATDGSSTMHEPMIPQLPTEADESAFSFEHTPKRGSEPSRAKIATSTPERSYHSPDQHEHEVATRLPLPMPDILTNTSYDNGPYSAPLPPPVPSHDSTSSLVSSSFGRSSSSLLLENSSSGSLLQSSPQSINDSIQGENLVPVASAPPDSMSQEAPYSEEDYQPARPRLHHSPIKPRPVSTIEKPTYSKADHATGSKSPPIVRRLTRRGHRKTDSQSSAFSTIDINAETPVTKHERSQSRGSMSDATTPKGLFNKFFGKNKTDLSYPKAAKVEESPISPISISNMFASTESRRKKSSFDLDRKRISTILGDYTFTEQKKKSGDNFLSRRTTFKKNPTPSFEKLGPVGKKPSPTGVTIPVITSSTLHSNQSSFSASTKQKELPSAGTIRKRQTPYYFVDEKFRPVRKDSEEDRLYVLATSNNETFQTIDVTEISSVQQMKEKFAKAFGFRDPELARFYLTEFGCQRGEALDEAELEKLMDSGFFGGVCKIYVQPLTNLKTTDSGKGLALTPENQSTAVFADGLDGKMHRKMSPSVSKSLMTKTRSPSITTAKSITTTSGEKSPTVIDSAESFKVIRPAKEIDFDQGRDSPFAKSTASDNLVALRTPPLPPSKKTNRKPPPALPAETLQEMERRSSFKRLMSLSRQGTIRRKNTVLSKRGGFDPFSENQVNFENAPQLESSSESSDTDSDDDLFAKAPSRAKTRKKTSGPAIEIESNGADSLMTTSSSESSLDIRPPADVLYNNLEVYFPNTDLDKLIIDEVVSPPSSPVAEQQRQQRQLRQRQQQQLQKQQNDKDDEGHFHRMKSIRIVAREAQKRRSSLQGQNSLLRRTSTKMWGQKVIEVTPGMNTQRYMNRLRTKDGSYQQFAWVKGELIGVGTFGKVYLALNVTTGEMIAVKQTTISPQFVNNRKTREIMNSFKAEVETLKDLDHENIVQYLGFGRKGDTYSIFLEYVSGGSVGHLIRSYGKFNESLIRYLTKQVLQGLCYLHSKGILHRDLKADNLLLETDGICKISDFGISKKSKDIYSNDASMNFQGTVFWMAPEIVDNQSHKGYNAKVDIWSLGCAVLEMFSGKRPWADYAVAGAIYKLGTKSAPPISQEARDNMSPEGYSFLQRCFEVDPEKRPTAAMLLTDDFCKIDHKFKFQSTDLAGKMKFDNVQETRRINIMRQTAAT